MSRRTRTGTLNRKDPVIRDICGSRPGYQKHYRERERTCERCRLAQNRYQQQFRPTTFPQKARALIADLQTQADHLDGAPFREDCPACFAGRIAAELLERHGLAGTAARERLN